MCLQDHQDVLQFLLSVTNRISETLQLTSLQLMIIRETERDREREGFIRRFYIPSRDQIMMHGAHGIHPASLLRPVSWFCTGSVCVRADKQDRYSRKYEPLEPSFSRVR
jgi:hypothetical protein